MRLPEESPSPYAYVIFFPIAGVTIFFLEEETPSSSTACQGTLLELQNRGWEGMIVSSSFCSMFYMFHQFISLLHILYLFMLEICLCLFMLEICSAYVFPSYSSVVPYIALCLLQI